jgi:adenosylhomocysteinase
MLLADQGRRSLELAESRMPVLKELRRRYAPERPFAGQRLAGCLHLTKETGVLVRALQESGAQVAWTGGNQVSTQDDVAAALVQEGVSVFSWQGMTKEELDWTIDAVATCWNDPPTLLLDDGADLITAVHAKHPAMLGRVLGGTDKTTTGVERLRAMAAAGKLAFPVIGCNDVVTKWEFDNIYGTGQSTIDGILRAAGILLAGKTFVVAGFGHVGRGVALRAAGMGAQVIVTCIRATTALRAALEGFRVMPMIDAAPLGDVFCTTTGMTDVITGPHLDAMKDGAILANAGHSDCEINLSDLRARTVSTRDVRPAVREHLLAGGKRLLLLSDGGLVNLAAAEGNPSEVMDLSFANQFMGLLRLVESRGSLAPGVHDLTDEQDQTIARLKLRLMGVELDELTADQRDYANDFNAGT